MPTINFIWDDVSDNVLVETDENNQVTTTYIRHPEKYGEVFYDKQGNRFSYYHYDGNGSTRKLTGANQAVTKTYIFTGFGELIASPGLGSTPFAYKGAAGYYTNPVTNDIYVRARTYEPTTGRWLSKDPLGFVDGPNLYSVHFVEWGFDVESPSNASRKSAIQYIGHVGQIDCLCECIGFCWSCGENESHKDICRLEFWSTGHASRGGLADDECEQNCRIWEGTTERRPVQMNTIWRGKHHRDFKVRWGGCHYKNKWRRTGAPDQDGDTNCSRFRCRMECSRDYYECGKLASDPIACGRGDWRMRIACFAGYVIGITIGCNDLLEKCLGKCDKCVND